MLVPLRFVSFFLLLFLVVGCLSAQAQTSTLTATFRDVASDVVGQGTASPDGALDYRISLAGLRGAPTRINITSENGGIWNIPFDGLHWIIQISSSTPSTADIYFSQFSSRQFHIVVGYADGSSDQADAIYNNPPSTLTAIYRGLGPDVVNPWTIAPDGAADYLIRLGGLRGTPARTTVTSDTGGIWSIPFNGANWLVATTGQTATTSDIHFSFFASNQFHVRVDYPDGSYDEANATPAPSSLTAIFRGIGPDVTSPGAVVPDGTGDFRITLGGLRGAPSQLRITSETGIWAMPFNGFNWVIRYQDQGAGNGEVNFSQWPSQNFRVIVGYADGSSDQADAIYDPNEEPDVIRFLAQATFGQTQALISQVKQSGIATYIEQQATAPMQTYPDLAFWPTTRPATCIDTCQRDNYTFYPLQTHFFKNGIYGEDQLRQRVAFALSEILVTSQTDVPYPAWMRSYQQLLYNNAFGNYRQLLYDVTLSPTMGRFLDMVNSRCQRGNPLNVAICRNGLTSQPNENYAREVLQLFSIGTFRLNQDGSRVLDVDGNPIPTYNQKTIEEFARVFTGWVLSPNLPPPPELLAVDPMAATVPNYRDPMVVHKDSQNREDWHDFGSKTLLNGIILPSGQSTTKDLNDAIDNIAYNENVAPFISKQLIQHLVTSNPSAAYVRRIADTFTLTSRSSNQLFQVVRAILLDPEARFGHQDGATAAGYGKLREPALFMTNVVRAFDGTSDGVLNSLNVGGSAIGAADMNQDMFNPASVFNYFPPSARVPGENALGPEFAIFSSLSSLRRDNFISRVVFSTIPVALPNRPVGTSLNLAPWDAFAANPDQLLDGLNRLLLNGSMSAEMRASIKTAVQAIPGTDSRGRVRSAVYLILTSSQYQVER